MYWIELISLRQVIAFLRCGIFTFCSTMRVMYLLRYGKFLHSCRPRSSLYRRFTDYKMGLVQRQTNLSETLRLVASTYADRPFMSLFNDETKSLTPWMTYGSFTSRAQQFGSYLLQQRLAVGDRVGICSHHCIEWYIVEHACALFGYVSVALPVDVSPEQLASYIDRFQIKVLFTTPAIIDALSSISTPNSSLLNISSHITSPLLPIPRLPDSLEYSILLTSGSTGPPKGITYTRSMWHADFVTYPSRYLRGVSYLPLSHIVDRHHVAVTMFNGGQIVLAPSVTSMLSNLVSIAPSVLFIPPSLAPHLLRHTLPSCLHTIVVIAGSVSECIREQLETDSRKVVNPYGLTDVGNIAINGKILPHIAWKLRPVSDYEASSCGELLIKPPDATAVAVDSEGYFSTGDIVSLSDDDCISVLGRVSEHVKLENGEWLVPSQLEQVIETEHIVRDICIGVLNNNHVYAIVFVEEAQSAIQLRSQLNAVLLRHNYPLLRAVVLSSVPFTVANGLRNHGYKLNRVAIERKFEREIRLSTTLSACDVAACLLGESHQYDDETFRSLGGDSLLALEVKYEMQKHNVCDERLVTALLSNICLSAVRKILQQAYRGFNKDVFQLQIKNAMLQQHNKSQGTLKCTDGAILIVGAAGLVGSALWHMLSSSFAPGRKIYCLIRNTSLLPQYQDCTIISGDATLPNLGLPPDVILQLTREVTHIFHCAGSTNQMLPYDDLRPHVASTAQVLHLASQCQHLQRVILLSSTDVLPNNIEEVFPLSSDCKPVSGYARMKFEQEEVAHIAKTAGLNNLVLLRLGLLHGNNDIICQLIQGCREVGAVPDAPSNVFLPAILPVSVAADWIARLGFLSTGGYVYHLVNTTRLRCRDVFNALHLPVLPHEQWMARANLNKQLSTLLKYNNLFSASNRKIRCEYTYCIVKELQGKALPSTEELLNIIVNDRKNE